MDSEFRHEYKLLLSPAEQCALRSRLRAVLPHDPHAGPSGEYTIRSVYFDNWADKALREKLDGTDRREKFRIRWYNGNLSFISLEKKSKLHGLCRKESCPLTREEAARIFRGELSWLREREEPVARELAAKAELQCLRPRTVVDYRREAFVFLPGKVRLTLDREVRGCAFRPDLLEREPVTLPAGDQALLEIKYDRFLPELIRDLVQLDSRSAGAFSKYCAARGYH